jgi:hypothetical protein
MAAAWLNLAIPTLVECHSGRTMVGDMFDDRLKSKLDSICTELAAYVGQTPSTVFGSDRQTDRAANNAPTGGPLIWGNQVQLAHRMTFGTQYSPDDLLSMMVFALRFSTRAII